MHFLYPFIYLQTSTLTAQIGYCEGAAIETLYVYLQQALCTASDASSTFNIPIDWHSKCINLHPSTQII